MLFYGRSITKIRWYDGKEETKESIKERKKCLNDLHRSLL